MEYVYKDPPLPSLKRLRKLYRNNPKDSVLRVLEYETLAEKPLSGRVLDVGGGRKARYLKHLPDGLQVESVNIDPQIEPTWLIEPGAPFPMVDDSFDYVICLNTLEHIYDARGVVDEILRVLKPGGTAYVSVPFMFRIHAHPDDFFRGTSSWWKETFRRAGFSRLELQPLIWGRKTAAGLIGGYRGLMPASMNKLIAHLFDWAYAKLLIGREGNYSSARGQRICAVASGYFMAARK